MTAKKRFKRLVLAARPRTGESYSAALRHLRTNESEDNDVVPTRTPTTSCSFCGKASTEVRKIIAGPGVRICNQCIDLCNEILAEIEDNPDAAPKTRQPSPDRLLGWLPSIAKTLRSIEGEVSEKVAELRQQGVGWARNSDALGMTEAEVAERFSGSENAQHQPE